MYALVDVGLVLERLGPQQTRVGEWLNTIGYITSIQPSTDREKASDRGGSKVHVQAVLVWSAGSLDVQRYEASLSALEPEIGSSSGETVPSDPLPRAVT